MRICKVNIDVDSKTKVEFHDEIEPEIAIHSDDGILEIFGTKKDLKAFATKLYNEVHSA